VLLIDHNMALVMGVCDRIHVLDQGRRSRPERRRDPRRT
jgi:ABC-type branched-subunit amino acid transport system ATPase component